MTLSPVDLILALLGLFTISFALLWLNSFIGRKLSSLNPSFSQLKRSNRLFRYTSGTPKWKSRSSWL